MKSSVHSEIVILCNDTLVFQALFLLLEGLSIVLFEVPSLK